jgi:serine protease
MRCRPLLVDRCDRHLWRVVIATTLCFTALLSACAVRHAPYGTPSRPSFKVMVDTRLKATAAPLPVFPDGIERPLATLTDESGKRTDFVENELMVEFANQSDLTTFLTTWHGTVLAEDRPKTVGIDAHPTYLIRVRTDTADLSKLSANLAQLNPSGGSPVTVSSAAARRLIAAGAEAAVAGRHVGINYLTSPTGFQDEKLAEAASSGSVMRNDAGGLVEPWNSNPFQWGYMKRGGSFDIGVAAAWRVLDRTGAFKNKVTIAVIDGGFGGGDDFPAPYKLNKASLAALDPTGPNEVKCGDNDCPWHGWNVVNAAMGQVNNGIGAAGPAGPVGELLAIRRSADIFNNIQSITIALFSDASIINMSFSARVPASLSWSVIPFNLATLRASGAGKLLYASAGNDHEDINHTHCIGVCWEAAWITPCENGGVVCVGAMDAGAPFPRGDSNYGDDELDIWGPGSVWVAPDYGIGSSHVFTATSAATPFVAGVAALIWAANPGLDNDGVERVMYETAHQGRSGEVERWPNAYAAVIRALGGTPPELAIDVHWSQTFASCQLRFDFTATVTDPDHGPPVVTWTSDIDKVLGTGTFFSRTLSDGIHHITATAVDGTNLKADSNEVTIDVRNPSISGPKPSIDIISFVNHQTFAANQTITFDAGGSDPFNGLGRLIPANVRWTSSKDGLIGTGQRILRMLTPGAHYITVEYTGACGRTADDIRLIQVTKSVADAPPNMFVTTPSNNDLTARTDTTGQACLRVGGFGFDEEEQDFAAIEWWETSRSDLQWKVLSFEQSTTVCLKIAPNLQATIHDIRLRGMDKAGHSAYSAPIRVTVLPGVR